jgi:hypothetical protein
MGKLVEHEDPSESWNGVRDDEHEVVQGIRPLAPSFWTLFFFNCFVTLYNVLHKHNVLHSSQFMQLSVCQI